MQTVGLGLFSLGMIYAIYRYATDMVTKDKDILNRANNILKDFRKSPNQQLKISSKDLINEKLGSNTFLEFSTNVIVNIFTNPFNNLGGNNSSNSNNTNNQGNNSNNNPPVSNNISYQQNLLRQNNLQSVSRSILSLATNPNFNAFSSLRNNSNTFNRNLFLFYN